MTLHTVERSDVVKVEILQLLSGDGRPAEKPLDPGRLDTEHAQRDVESPPTDFEDLSQQRDDLIISELLWTADLIQLAAVAPLPETFA
jgi:hypothetical protein